MDTRSFIIPVANKSLVDTKIQKLNKRALKLGLDPVSIHWAKATIATNGCMVLPCELTGPLTISFDGYEFIATLQHLPTGENIIRSISDKYEIPLEYRSSGSACEHCNVKRYRKDTYVVRHESGEAKQVGSTCIRDFLGGNSPDNIMQRASFIGELLSFMEGSESNLPDGSKINNEGLFDIVNFLAQTSACIRDFGWLSKTEAYNNGGTSTASRVQDNISPPNSSFKRSLVTGNDARIARDAAEWAENLSDDEVENSDYLYNIRAIARSGMVGWRTIGFAASIINSYNKNNVIKTESNFVGSIKNRNQFELIARKHSEFDGPFGHTWKYSFQDMSGNILVWFSSSPQTIYENNTYLIKGTITKHNEFRGVKETIINRCQIINDYDDIDDNFDGYPD